VNELKPRGILDSKRTYFHSYFHPPAILNKFRIKVCRYGNGSTQYSSESSGILKSCTIPYSCKEYAVVINNSGQKFSTDFVQFHLVCNEQFRFCQSSQILTYSLIKFKFKTDNIQYSSCLVNVSIILHR
jgi:hypothetical protein